ncbi:DUF2087 domain-containing protein [Microlunatus soli]|uniref:DUF2087 domain-containing protein n=1 Tax=Microlunatus soli TaxID=630515 RepID=A0A1H1P4Q2_9ACTN|nr:DUF2087 domain-containing protein [Microlunatus soli]SDS05965.1 hypothetical protein SAMN04489812_0755 [Microlunatus soli]
MTTAPDLVLRHRAARLLHELCRPASAAVIAQLPSGPGRMRAADLVRDGSALSIKEFWTTVSRLEALGVLRRRAGELALDHDHRDLVVGQLVADSPLLDTPRTRPRLAAFVQSGRFTRMPTEPVLLDELYDALAELFTPGETMTEAGVNARIAAVHDDPAEIRRGLVDRGLLHRAPGSTRYRCPDRTERR